MTLAVYDEIVAFDIDRDAIGAQQRRRGGKAIRLLDPQLLEPAHHRGAFGESGGNGEHRIFIDHGRRALRRHFDGAQRP